MSPKLHRALESLRSHAATARRELFQREGPLNTLAYRRTSRAIERRKAVERCISDVLTTVLDVQPGWDPYRVKALQHREEFEEFTEYVAARNPLTVLEIGLFQGGTSYVWTRGLESTQHVVGVDQPVWNETVHRRRRELYSDFSEDTRLDVVYGDSHAVGTYDQVEELIDDDVDLLFVDGDHTYDGVKEDFRTYRRLLGDGGIVAFHDVRRHARDREEKRARLDRVDDLDEEHVSVGRPAWGVHEFWEEVRAEYDTREFLSHSEQMGMGIGVVELR